MTPLESYKLYVALHSHFTTNYDFFKYNGKTKANATNFHQRKDRYKFEQISRHNDPLGLMLSNFVHGEVTWAGDLLINESKANYQAWKIRNSALRYTFKEDLKKLDRDFNSNFHIEEGEHPNVVKQFLAERISPETLCILMEITGCQELWKKKLSEDDVVWNDVNRLYEKYHPFLHYDLDEFRRICLTYFK
jgi:Straboviridae DNA helicase loader